MSADHGRFDELAVGWALHALEPEDEAEFRPHLAGCARCAATVAETTEAMASMATDLPIAEPADALRGRLRAAVGTTEQVHRAAVPGPAPNPAVPAPRFRRPRVLPMALVAAAVAAVAGLGIWNAGLRSDRAELSATVAEQREVVEALLAPGRATVATLDGEQEPVATVVARGDRLQVVTYGLPANDDTDSTYVVWGLGAGAPVALGAFDVQGSQMAVETVGSGQTGLDGFAQYGISIEPGRVPPPEPTEVVATGQVTS